MSIQCSAAGLPKIDRAGEFPLLNPAFEFSYRNPTHVIHLYGYGGRIRVNAREFRFRPGDLTCIQSGSVYSIQTDTPGKHWCIHFSEHHARGTVGFELPDHVPLGSNSGLLREQIKQIASLIHTFGAGTRPESIAFEARHRLKALLLSIHNLRHKGGPPSARKDLDWDRLLSWIDDHLDDQIFTSELARQAGVGPNTLARRFKLQHQTTVAHYLLHKRIERAKSLLATTTLPVREVGISVGISDPQYFNKQFRRLAGLSPGSYRNEHGDYLDAVSEELAVKGGRWEPPATAKNA